MDGKLINFTQLSLNMIFDGLECHQIIPEYIFISWYFVIRGATDSLLLISMSFLYYATWCCSVIYVYCFSYSSDKRLRIFLLEGPMRDSWLISSSSANTTLTASLRFVGLRPCTRTASSTGWNDQFSVVLLARPGWPEVWIWYDFPLVTIPAASNSSSRLP